jgi:hypothetical protein
MRPGCETSRHYFSCSGGTGAVSTKSAPGHITLNSCFLHLVGSTCHVVHSRMSGARNIGALFFVVGWARCGFHKTCAGTHYVEYVFCIQCDLRVTYCILLCPGHKTSTRYFSCSGGTDTDSAKSTPRHVTPNMFLHLMQSAGHVVHSGASRV